MAEDDDSLNSLKGPRLRARTMTSSFGVSSRESHDSSRYYNARMHNQLVSHREVGEANKCPEELLDSVIVCDSKNMPLPDNCIHHIVTSPPYNVSKAYDENLTFDEYISFLFEVFTECYRVLTPGGRMVVNVANLGRKPYIPLASYVNLMMHEIGFLHRGEIIWDKSASAGSSCAWGSFQSASNPCLRDIHEYLLIYSKGDYKLPRTKLEREKGRTDSIGRDEFIQQTKSIWSFPTESAKRVKHPAPFPVELPLRCIEMYSFVGDIVLDPFLGSGTTAIAAKMCGRHWIGFDLSEEYCEIAKKRLDDTTHLNFTKPLNK